MKSTAQTEAASAEKPAPRKLRTIDDRLQWKPILEMLGRANTGFGGALLHVYNQGLKDGGYVDQYDQPVLVESPGAVVVAMSGDKVGFVQNFRLVGERPVIVQSPDEGYALHFGPVEDVPAGMPVTTSFGKKYVELLLEHGLMAEMIERLGAWCWELIAGIAPGDAKEGLAAHIRKVAKTEASEEAGFDVEDVENCGMVNFNPTFFAHPQHVVRARIVGVGDNRPEEWETLGRARLFTREEILRAIRIGEHDSCRFDDGRSLSALVKAGYLR